MSDDTVCADSTTAASQQTAELMPGTKAEHFPNSEREKEKKERSRPDRSPSQQLLITAEDVLCILSHTMKCEFFFFSCSMKQMDFLCAYCDTILKLCHYMSGKALLTMVVMGTMAKAQHVQFLVA